MSETAEQNHKRNYGECLERERVHLTTMAALQEENRDLVHALEKFVNAAQSWHDFHNHTNGIQCDLLCAAIAPARAVLERTTDAIS